NRHLRFRKRKSKEEGNNRYAEAGWQELEMATRIVVPENVDALTTAQTLTRQPPPRRSRRETLNQWRTMNKVRIIKSSGVTPTERLLADLCDRSFLKLWSYPNPYKEDRNELCDLLAVFENHVFIFFDRENKALEKDDNDPMVNWNRWKKKVID